MTFARIHHYLAMATPLIWMRQEDSVGVLGLAENACAQRDGFSGRAGANRGPRPLRP